MLDQISNDVRLAWRGLRRSRSFAAIAVATLAAGVVGTTAMFAIVEGVLLKPLPVRDQERLVVVWKELPGSGGPQSPFRAADITLLNEDSRTIDRAAGYGFQDPLSVSVSEGGAMTAINLSRVTGDFFEVLGVAPLLGRTLTRADDVAGAERVVVLSHRLWQQRYAGARDALGRRIVINEDRFTIVGIMPADMEFPRGADAWVAVAPLASTVRNPAFREAVMNELRVVARLRPAVSVGEAARELTILAPRIEAHAPPQAPRGLTPALRAYEEAVVGDVRGAMLVLVAAVALVLLIATANVANLLLMRGEARRPELAIRAALGASRGDLARQVVTETAVLATVSAAIGLIVAQAALPAMMRLVPNGLPRADAVRVDLYVVLFTALAAFIAAACAAAPPAVLATRARLALELANGGRISAGRARRNGRRALVVAQVALAVVVLAATGLLTRTLMRLHAAGDALAADRLMLVPLAMPEEKYADPDRRLQFLNAAMERLESLPAIASATPVNVEPFSGIGWDVPVFVGDGQSRERAEANPSLNFEAIHPNYFETFEVDIVRGRPFTAADRADAPLVAIVSEDVAARTWPGQNALGKRLKMGGFDSKDDWRTVVGIAAPTRYRDIRERRATLYVPAEQLMVSAQMFVVRTSSVPGAIATAVIDSFREVDPDVRVLRVAPLADLLARPLARPRFNAFLIGVFGMTALFLAAVGLYAVMAAYVGLRGREIGVRVALGATLSQIRRLVIGEGCRLAGAGVAVGLAIAAASNQLVRGLLFEVDPLDPVAILAAAGSLLLAAGIACYVPARRAIRTDPIAMLRAE